MVWDAAALEPGPCILWRPMTAFMWIVLAYHVASRLGYVGYVGVALWRQKRDRYFTDRWGTEPGFRRFRRVAAFVMINDGASLVAACLVTHGTLRTALPGAVVIPVGALLILVGVVTKVWAGAALGGRAYYWYDFFNPSAVIPQGRGPYRLLRNPMYTVGYLHTYGLALVTASLPGLAAAAFDQIAILLFYWRVEKPHVDEVGAGI